MNSQINADQKWNDIRFQMHVWVSRCRMPSPWPAWSTLQPFWPCKKSSNDHRSHTNPTETSTPNSSISSAHWSGGWDSLFNNNNKDDVQKTSSLQSPNSGLEEFEHNDFGLSKVQFSYWEMTQCSLLLQGESQQCQYPFVLQKEEWSACRHLGSRTISTNRPASSPCSFNVWTSTACLHVHTARWGLMSIAPVDSKSKPAETELGCSPMAKGIKLMLSNLFYSFLLNKPSLWHFASLTNTYHNSIFIWHNGPICLLLTYTTVSLHSSNHWKLTVFFSLLGWGHGFGSFILFSLHEFEWNR